VNNRWIVWAAAAWLTAAGACVADDVVKTMKGTKIEGKVTTTPTEVNVDTGGISEKVPVNEVESIVFDGEPGSLASARKFVVAGRFEEGLKELEKVKLGDGDRDEVKQELEYLKAYSAAKLALAGSGPVPPAGKAMLAFVKAHPSSHHFLEANELLGDLLVTMGRYSDARTYYEQVAKAPWPDFKMRASVAAGQALLAEGKPAEALKFFNSVLAQKVEGELAEAQRMAAALGRARCQAEAGEAEPAIKTAEAVIARADAEDADLLGRAYNTLGLALDKAGKPREAMFAFLHVDTLYSSNREAHAEALYHLVRVFRTLRKPDRAKDAETTLKEEYAESRWNKAPK
jgi:tetratricopeptide (TPR) repeat protein